MGKPRRNFILAGLRSNSWQAFLFALSILFLVSCGGRMTTPPAQAPSRVTLANELIFYDWDEDMPQSVLDAFTREYKVKVKYLVYESQEEAIANMEAGERYDVVVMESRFIPMLAQGGLLADLDQSNIPNLKNISANFRELAYDPNNQYSVPYNWGTTGLVVRTDLAEQPVSRWSDLWDPRYAGHVGLWIGQRREVISLTLKSLGYSANTEDPDELEQALRRLLELKPSLVPLEDFNLDNSSEAMAGGSLVLSMGYAYDAIAGAERNSLIRYVMPREGALLWNDTFVVPANSANRSTAEVFLNFLMRPDINAMIANENQYATTNEAALELIAPEVLHNPVIFPPNSDLEHAELILPLSAEGQRLYDRIWERFSAAP